jgi:hypothetical protein
MAPTDRGEEPVSESGRAVSASVPLYLAFSAEAESLHGVMLATRAGHIILALTRRRGLHLDWDGIAGHSACRLALLSVRADGGTLIRDGRDPIWTGIPQFWGPVLYQLSYAPTGGIQGFAPKNALRLFSQWWRSCHKSLSFQAD